MSLGSSGQTDNFVEIGSQSSEIVRNPQRKTAGVYNVSLKQHISKFEQQVYVTVGPILLLETSEHSHIKFP